MKIERAGKQDYRELMDMMARAFRMGTPGHPRFEVLLPDLYQPTEACMGAHRIIRERGKIVSSAGVYPIDLRIGAIRLRVAGIGAVCTLPKRRGKGYMSLILKQIWRDMAAEGYALSWLSGDRARYARYGWERAGSSFEVSLTSRTLSDVKPCGWMFRRLVPGKGDLRRILGARGALVSRGLCSPEDLVLKLRRANVQVWEGGRGRLPAQVGLERAGEAGGGYAFCAVNARWRRLVEWGGDPEGVLALLKRVAVGPERWVVDIPPLRDRYADAFLAAAENLGHTLHNLAVVDLPALLRAYAPWLAPRWPRSRRLRLAIRDRRGPRSRATLTGGKVVERAGPDPVTVALGELAMARFLFGPARPSLLVDLPDSASWLDEVFPLPFYVPYLWHV